MDVEFLVSDVKFYTISHLFSEQLYQQNTLLVGVSTETNLIKILKIQNMKRVCEYVIDYYNILPSKLKQNYQFITVEKLDILYLTSELTDKYTIFVKLQWGKNQYVYQLNVENDFIVNYTPVYKLYESPRIYIGYSDIKKVTYTDNQKITLPIRGLLYIDTGNPSDIKGKYIRQIKVFATESEKQQLIRENKITKYDIYPIVDRWSNQDQVVLRLPGTTKSQQFDFSVGLGVLELED